MEQIINQNSQLIKQLKEKILEEEKKLSEIKTERIDISKFSEYYKQKKPGMELPKPEELKKLAEEERKERAQAQLDIINNLKADLDTAITANDTAIQNLNEIIEQIKNMLSAKDILLNSQSDTNSSQSNNSNTKSSSTNINNGPSNPKIRQSKKAKNQLKNMIGTKKDTGVINVADFKQMLHSESYEELVTQAKQLRGPFSKNDITVFYDVAFKTLKRNDEKRIVNQHGNTMINKIDEILRFKY